MIFIDCNQASSQSEQGSTGNIPPTPIKVIPKETHPEKHKVRKKTIPK
jgi:hypothetical protein